MPKKLKKKSIRAIDLFSGLGGSSCGAAAAGVEIVAAVDAWKLAGETYQENFPDVEFLPVKCEDVDLPKLKEKIGSVDLIIASPECTSHTCAKGNAPRSELSRKTAFQVIRFAEVFKPRWLVIENVVHMRSWRSYKTWKKALETLGYKVTEQVINASDRGVPQARRRLFVMCDALRQPAVVKAKPGKRRSAASILSKDHEFTFRPLKRPKRAKATLERAKRAMSEIGEKSAFLLVYYGSDAAGGWQRLESPLRTLTTLDRFAYVRPSENGHEMRMLQVPEIRSAMGFPEDYVMNLGSRREKVKLLGNAVCPPVMTAVIQTLTDSGTAR